MTGADDAGEAPRPVPAARAPAPRTADRAAREAAALRENLRRRKDQARARAGATDIADAADDA